MDMINIKRKGYRVDKELWLRTALETVAHTNSDKISIDALANKLNVTKGSFYHHFKSRQDLVDQIIEYWVQRFNAYVIETVSAIEGSGEEKLLALMKLVNQEGLNLYDTTLRAWAAKDSKIAAKILEVDLDRYKLLKSLFSEMGFEGEELEIRTRIWLIFASGQAAVNFPDSGANPDDFIALTHEFFTRRL